MARKPTGAVLSHTGNDGRTYRSLRFTAYGTRRFVSLGPVTEAEAQRKLRHVLADVERDKWEPERIEAQREPEATKTFHAYAEEWWLLNVRRWSPRTVEDYKWRLERDGGLVDHFGEMPLDRITVDTVEGFVAAKLAEGTLSPRSINMQVVLLAQILEAALDRGLIPKNPAVGKKRRAPERRPQRSYLDSADSIESLLDAAGQMDADRRDQVHRRAIATTLLFAGLRIGELCELTWGDVNLGAGWLSVRRSKTDAGVRRVRIRGILRDALLSIRPLDVSLDSYVFATAKGGPSNPSNIRNRLLAPAEQAASAALVKRGGLPLPHVTPHSCRRTFASVLYAIGETPPTVMAEMGHTSPQMALSAYAQAMNRDEQESAKLKALVEGAGADFGSPIGRGDDIADSESVERDAA